VAEEKKLLTRSEFEEKRVLAAREMNKDARLKKDALDVLVRADKHLWVHQATWMGEPALNLPQDIFALQEIIWQTRPRYVLEIGVAWGGGLLFAATMLEAIGQGTAIGVDTYIPEDLRARLASKGSVSARIELVLGDSVEDSTYDKVCSLVGGSRQVLVILDSSHTHEHVLRELLLYSRLVGVGQYLVCCDTILDDLPAQKHRVRPWGPGNSPKTAVKEFLSMSDRFEIDETFDAKLLFSCNPGGYLKCVGETVPA
jgi:cephalosporin hydroxylase